MNELDLYAIIEQDLDFSNEINHLYKYYHNLLKKLKITSIIDIGCGQGAFLASISLAIKKYGIDLSERQIQFAKEKGINAEVINIIDVKEKFMLASAIFDVINYIQPQELEKFFTSTNDILLKDGYFVFDINSKHGFTDVAQGSLIIDKKEKFIGIDAVFNDNKLHTTINYFSNNGQNYSRLSNTIIQHYHDRNSIEQKLAKANFKILKIEKFHLHDIYAHDKLIVIAQKKN